MTGGVPIVGLRIYFEKGVLVATVVGLAVLVGLGAYSYQHSRQTIETALMVSSTREIINRTQKIENSINRTQAALSQDAWRAEAVAIFYKREIDSMAFNFVGIRRLAEDPLVRQLLDSIQQVGRPRHMELLHQLESGSRPDAQDSAIFAPVLVFLSQIKQRENVLLEERMIAVARGVQRFNATFGALLVFAFLLLLAAFFILNRNLRKRIKTESSLREIQQKLLYANKELESFTYSVSHDLRAPLRSIHSYTNILEQDFGSSLPEEAHRLLGIVKRNAQRMGQLIDDLLALSRVSRGEIRKTEVDMAQMVGHLMEEVRSQNLHRIIRWEVGTLHPCRGDYNLLQQVWMNFISNAVKYSSKKEETLISIRSVQEELHTMYSVADNGVGFNPAYGHKLFQVFQRLHKPQDFEGTGVGLAIAARIIHRHGGEVWAEGEEGKGATFRFSIPNA